MSEHVFKGTIWTNHALSRLRERGIKQGDAWATWRSPDQSRRGKSGNWLYYRTWGNQRIEVVAKQNDKKEWIILSVWSKTIMTKPKKTNQNKESFFKKLLKFILNQ